MGLLSVTYAVSHPLDGDRLAAAIEGSTGVRTRITRRAQDYVALSCSGINGVAELSSSKGRVQLEVMLPVSAYFLEHVETALEEAGARRLERDGSPSEPRAPSPLANKRWSSLPLRQRLAGGRTGQLLILLALPFLFGGAVVRWIWRRIRIRA